MPRLIWECVALAGLFFSLALRADGSHGPAQRMHRTFYLDPSGRDQNDGSAPGRAWRSLARLEKTRLTPGDQIVLAEGARFNGSIRLTPQDAGTPLLPIVIRSAGKHRTIIYSPNRTAISASAGGLEIRDLVLEGGARAKKEKQFGIGLMADGKHGEKYGHVRIDNVDISGFGDSGVAVGSLNATRTGFEDILITHVSSHGNFGEGITSWDDAGDRARGYAHRDIRVVDCDASHNPSGSGIVISGVEGGLVEYCRTSGNAGAGGGVGLWAWNAKGVTIQHCISDATRTKGGDGGGFDLDGGCVDCTIQYCMAYENDGPGYMHCDYPGAPRTHGNVIRRSISVNDGRKKDAGTVGFGFVTWGSGLDECLIANNLVCVTSEAVPRSGAALFVAYVSGSQQATDVPHVRGCVFRDNVVQISEPGVDFVDDASPSPSLEKVRFEGDIFLAPSPLSGEVSPGFREGSRRYATLEEWHAASSQEPPPHRHAARIEVGNYRLTEPRNLAQFPLMKAVSK